MSKSFIRKDLPVLISFITGFSIIIAYFVKEPITTAIATTTQNWSIVIWSFMLGIGILNILFREVNTISKKTHGKWPFSVVVLVFLVPMILAGIFGGVTHPLYDFLFTNFTIPLNQASAALMGFYVISGAFRAFRARNIEVTLLLLGCSIVMLGNVPLGKQIWSGFPLLRDWILEVPNIGYGRGIGAGMAIGTIALGVRTLLGYEKAALGIGIEE